MTHIKPNANFYSLSGKSVRDDVSEEYREYRRCWLENPLHFLLRDFPMHLDIEATSRCNLRCTFCDKLPLLQRNQLGHMELDLFKRIIDEGREHKLWGVKLSYRGEPLLHPHIAEMVAYAKKQGVIDVYFNTNAMLLTQEMSSRLIDAGLDRISISIEGTDPAAYEKERIGAKFDSVKGNIEALKTLRELQSISHPQIRIQTIYSQGIDLTDYKEFWQPFCDEVAAVDYKDESIRKMGMAYDWACPQLWQRMTIEWDGTVLPCNNDDLRMLSPGNVRDKSVYSCWHSEKVNEVRNLHREGKSHQVQDCDGCPWRTAQICKLLSS